MDPDRVRGGGHLQNLQTRLAKYRQFRPQRYQAVNVLLISWEDDDTGSAIEIDQLATLLREAFNYKISSYLIPSTKPETSLNLKLASFLDAFGGPENLLLIYYGGHGGLQKDKKGSCIWAANNHLQGPSLDWAMIQPSLFTAGCDVAILLDSCYAGQAAKPISSHAVELLAATDKDHWTPNNQSQWPTFTKILIQEMGRMVKNGEVVTLRGLAKVMSAQDAGLYRQPFHVSLSGDHSAGPIKLARLLDAKEMPDSAKHMSTAVSFQLKLSLFEPLDSMTASSLMRWMTKDSPTSIEDIQLADQVLNEARETSQFCHELLDNNMPDERPVLSYLSNEGQAEGLALLQQLKTAMSEPGPSSLNDFEAMDIIQRVRKRSQHLVTFIEDSLARLNSSCLHALQASETFNNVHKDLKDRIAMRLTLIANDVPIEQTRIAFHAEDPARANQRLRRGMKNSLPILVEYFYYNDIDGDSRDNIMSQVKRISALHAESKGHVFHSMHGLGYLRESLLGPRYGILYQLPAQRKDCRFSLLSALLSQVKVVPLEIRMRTAYALCEALLSLHSIGWYHKGIKSDNVLIFAKSAATADGSLSAVWDFHNPYLIGFDCSRPSAAETRGTVDFLTKHNIYRHPDRWGRAIPFERHHDIYALGILLLECACWRSLPNMDSRRDNFEHVKNPEHLRDLLLGGILSKTAHSAGTQFASAAKFCLEKRNWAGYEEWQIQKMVRQNVLEPIKSCCV